MIEANRQRLSRQHDESISQQREPSPIVRIGSTRSDIQLSNGVLADGGNTSGIKIFNDVSEGQLVSAIKPPSSQIGTFDELSSLPSRKKKEDDTDQRRRKKKKKNTLFWFFCTIRYGSGFFTVQGSDYEQYADFVSGGEVVKESEDLVKIFNGIRVEVRSLFDKSIEINIKIEGIPFPVMTSQQLFIDANVECWRKFPRPDGKISVSRKVFYANYSGQSGFLSNFTLFKGNPGDRTEPATRQGNNYYKSSFSYLTVGIPIARPNGLVNFYGKAIITPKSSRFSLIFLSHDFTNSDIFKSHQTCQSPRCFRKTKA